MVKRVLINLLVFLVLIAGINWGIGFWFSFNKPVGPSIVEKVSVSYIASDPTLGFKAVPSVESLVTKSAGEKIIYRLKYRFDEFGRRKSPLIEGTKKEKYLVVLGDSNVFGEGVDSHQILSYFLEKRHPSYRSYNYAFRGWGPGNTLALTETNKLKEEIEQDSGIVLYFYMLGLEERLIGSTGLFRWSVGWHPYYFLDNDKKLQRSGTFKSDRPLYTWLQTRLAKSSLNQYFKVNFPDAFSGVHFEKLCQSFSQIKANVEAKMNKPEFRVVLWRRASHPGKLAMIKNCLRSHDIQFVNLTNIEPADGGFDVHSLDPHLNHWGHAHYATEISRYLLSRGLISL